MKINVVFVATLMALTAQISAQDSAGVTSTPSSQDQAFVQKAARDGATEVAIGKQVVEHASLPATRKMAQRLVDDHSRANRDLADIARRERINVPGDPDPDAMATASGWSSLQGQAYDHAYTESMIKAHQQAITLFSQGAQSNDTEIQRFARNTLPLLKEHLSMATRLADASNASDRAAALPEGSDSH